MKKHLVSIILLFAVSYISISQRSPYQLNLKGTIMGYDFDPKKGLFKKQKLDIQGTLDGVKIELKENGKTIKSTASKSGGDFDISIPTGSIYELCYTKNGYGRSKVTINLNNINDDLAAGGLLLKDIELLLNDFESSKAIDNGKSLGSIQYNKTSKFFYFIANTYPKKELLFKKEEDNAPLNLIIKSLQKNEKENINPYILAEENNKHQPKTTKITIETSETEKNTPVKSLNIPSRAIKEIGDWSKLTKGELDDWAAEINSAWDQLEKDKLIAVTPEEMLIIKAREELLRAAEKELEGARAYIKEINAKIRAQQMLNLALIGLAIILVVFIFFIVKRSIERRKTNAELSAKNKKITDSINYAERIQKSILLSDSQITSILPESFIFHRPLSIVSGDFYWFSEINGKIIFAAIDCTGHGVPGAFMSLIGNTLLNQIVNEKKISSPASILNNLHLGIVKSLHQEDEDKFSQDGMEMSICTLDKVNRKLTFAGAMNPIFIIQNGELIEHSANLMGIGGRVRRKKSTEIKFQEKSIELQKDDCVYLFSDGYMDQFGGEKKEKFNLPNFRNLLQEIHKSNVSDQKIIVEKTFDNWKGKNKQLDDVLLIGVKI